MNKKITGIIIIICGIVVLGGAVYVLLFSKYAIIDLFSPKVNENWLVNDQKPGDTSIKPVPQELQKEIEPSIVFKESDEKSSSNRASVMRKEDLMRMAASFAERFGSYSNQSNFSNIRNLYVFMSRRMQGWADRYIDDQIRKDNQANIYYGIITQAITEEVTGLDYDTGHASIIVKTRRRESLNTSSNSSESFDQNIIISLIKEAGVWKVDKANWQESK